METEQPLILTLEFDSATFALFNDMRRAHFPARRNVVPAHVTLFHALPGDQETRIRGDLANVSAKWNAMPLSFPDVQFLGRGVAVKMHAPALLDLRRELAEHWHAWLSAQDKQPYRPHVTIQNKVTAEAARALFAELSQSWRPIEGTGEGLVLWRYLGGPWEQIAEFPFAGSV